MWSLNDDADVLEYPATIAPDQILYDFDGPKIFTAKFGFFDCFFVYIDDANEDVLWLSAIAQPTVIDEIIANRLSVRAAFLQDRCWVVQTDIDMKVDRFWTCAFSELSEEMLPVSGVALLGFSARVPDTIEQAKSFFSIGFKGRSIANNSMPFSVLKSLVDSAYDVSRKVLGPAFLQGAKSGTYDFSVEPRISSLILAIEEPTYNQIQVEKRLGKSDLTFEDVEKQVVAQRVEFFNGMNAAVAAVRSGEAKNPLDAASRKAILQVQAIIPDLDYRFNSVEFSANFGDTVQTIYIDRQVGGRIKRAFNRNRHERSQRTGSIVEINAESKTFLIKGRNDRLTTCVMSRDIFEELQDDEDFVLGAIITVRGHLEHRQRRDRIWATHRPEM